MNCSARRPCFIDHLFLNFDLCQVPRRKFLQFFPFLVHCCFRIRNFHRLEQWNKLVHQIVMTHRIIAFACDVVFVFCRLKRFRSLPCGIMRFHYSAIIRFGNVLGCNFMLCNHFRGASLSFPFARHGRCHRSLQFSLSISEHCRVSASRFSCLFFSILSGFTHFRPYFWTYMIWSGSRLNFCQSHPGQNISFGSFFFQ